MSGTSTAITYTPLAPLWLVAPMALLAMLAVASHVLLLWSSTMHPSRRRIRLFNGLIMLVAIPIATYAFGIVTPAHAGLFQFAWLLTAGLLLIILLLAILDALNSLRLHALETRRILRKARPDPKPPGADTEANA